MKCYENKFKKFYLKSNWNHIKIFSEIRLNSNLDFINNALLRILLNISIKPYENYENKNVMKKTQKNFIQFQNEIALEI